MTTKPAEFTWTFCRIGGLEQIIFTDAESVCRLRELDPKLWVALSCPAQGLEFDQRTLQLIDTDRDGRIRIPEVVAAAEWLCQRLVDPAAITVEDQDAMPLAAIATGTDDGDRLLKTAKTVLASLGRGDADALTQEDVRQATLHASEQMFNGDGILPALPGLPEDVRLFIQDAMAVIGGIDDVGGAPGIDKAIADAFVSALKSWRDWTGLVAGADAPLGKDTPSAWEVTDQLRSKIDDYFLRCDLAAYSPAALDRLNLEEMPLTEQTGLLETSVLAELPLSKAGPDKPLDLVRGINPAWQDKVNRFVRLAGPLLRDTAALTREDWRSVQDRLAPFAQATAAKPAVTIPPSVTEQPTKAVEDLGEERIDAILAGDVPAKFATLADEDLNGPAASTDIANLERLVLYYLHLYRLLTNFVNFSEFYANDRKAAFQSGSLFIDGRSCHLCLPVDNIDNHAAIAAGSELFLLYCTCTRGKNAATADAEKKMNIVAAVTAGDSDLLVIGRNGVFVDNRGDDWDATVVKIVTNPIGLWQAVWTPYKKIGNLITEQISKFASAKQATLMDAAGKKLDEVSTTVVSGAAPRFDVGRNVGIFAAVGLALGAIGTAIGSISRTLLAMNWWQLPLLVLGLFVLVSGPSVIMAWLKLRKRTMGPLLEATGWAINGRVKLTYGLAKRLSRRAEMPPNAHRSQFDPVSELRRNRRNAFWLAAAVGALLVIAVIAVEHFWRKRDIVVAPPVAGVVGPVSAAPALLPMADADAGTPESGPTPPDQPEPPPAGPNGVNSSDTPSGPNGPDAATTMDTAGDAGDAPGDTGANNRTAAPDA
ncbi:MAG: hypothetical protein LIQ30_12455 [Planctomycetes bacterium]|nr:hypothetical protein [Planctomycetota bacterium]